MSNKEYELVCKQRAGSATKSQLEGNSIYVGLGSNINDPITNIKLAIKHLKKIPHTKIQKISKLYLTKPVGYSHQPDFINAVANLITTLEPSKILTHLQNIENIMGRIKTFRNGPRIIDVDLLMYADLILNTKQLILPHPHMHERAFVVIPLLEIEPAFKHRFDLDLINTQYIKEILCL